MYSINFWPILVSTIVSFAIGTLWYSPILFGKEWVALTGMKDEDMTLALSGGIWKKYATQLVMTVVMFIVTAFAISSIGVTSGSDGGFVGFIAWLGFIIPIQISGLLWKREPFKLILIDSVNYLLVLTIGGAIIGAWR